MNLGQFNAAALTALANGGKAGAKSYINLHVPDEMKPQVISTVKTVIKRNEKLAKRRQRKAA